MAENAIMDRRKWLLRLIYVRLGVFTIFIAAEALKERELRFDLALLLVVVYGLSACWLGLLKLNQSYVWQSYVKIAVDLLLTARDHILGTPGEREDLFPLDLAEGTMARPDLGGVRFEPPESIEQPAVLLRTNQRTVILKLPSRSRHPGLPLGSIPVRLFDESILVFRMMKEYCNYACPEGGGKNQLDALMKEWFGLSAGHPGTIFYVRFTAGEEGWRVEKAERVRIGGGRRRLLAIEPYLYALPSVILIAAIMMVPLVIGISYAFRDIQILNAPAERAPGAGP